MKRKSTSKYSTKLKDTTNMVMEKEMSEYVTTSSTSTSFSSISSDDARLLIDKSRNGISMQRIDEIMNRYELTLKDTASILNISERTLQRYEPSDILSKDATDRALHLQRLYERGKDVFGTLDRFIGWMKSPIFIFNNEKPISFLDTIFGFELLEQELGRIEHGIFA